MKLHPVFWLCFVVGFMAAASESHLRYADMTSWDDMKIHALAGLSSKE